MSDRQVIVTWYTPEEKLPEKDVFTIVTISGKIYNVTYDHAFAIATYYKNEGWVFDDMFLDVGRSELTVDAWADLEPYGGNTDADIQKMQDIEQAMLEKAYECGKQDAAQWIPCERELPEVGRSVLISVGGMYTAEGCLREDGDWTQFRWGAIQRKDMVGAWMPLPEPYEGEQS